MTILGFVPDDVIAKMADLLRTVLSSVSIVAAPPDAAAYAAAVAAASAAETAAEAALIADAAPLWRIAAEKAYAARALSIGVPAIAAKQWNVSSLYPNWDDFKKATPSAGQTYGGHLLLSHQGSPFEEMAPPAWHQQMRIKLRMGIPSQRATGQPSDLAAITYMAECRRQLVEQVILNRRWGYNNVYSSGMQDWNKVEDADPGMITMDNTVLVRFTFKVSPVG